MVSKIKPRATHTVSTLCYHAIHTNTSHSGHTIDIPQYIYKAGSMRREIRLE